MTLQQETQLQTLLTEAHDSYKEALSSYAYFKVSNRMVSEDLVQNTFMKTWVYLVNGGKVERMKSFLYHVLNNLIVDEYRKHKAMSLDVLLEKGFEISVSDSKNFNLLDGGVAVNLIERLPETYKNLVHMKYLQDLSTEEISFITGLSKNAVAVRLHRGLKKLKVLCPY